jgi:CarD family transcriptional regulator
MRRAVCAAFRSIIFGGKVDFKIGQKVVYPNHGVGTIEKIEQKQIDAENALAFYALRLGLNNSLVLVPVCNADEIGLRVPISHNECESLFTVLSDDFSEIPSDWKIRHREYSDKVRTGNVFEVADVLKKLTYLNRIKPLSFRESRLLEKARYLVISELAAVCRQKECQIEQRVEQALDCACTTHQTGNLLKAASAANAH